jgi:hypothetical protein
MTHGGVEHAGQHHVDAKHRLAGGLGRGFQPWQRLADDRELRRRLEHRVGRAWAAAAAAAIRQNVPACRWRGSAHRAHLHLGRRHAPGCWAAAATSMARAEAPASRMGSHKSFRLDEPPVIISPNSRMALAVSQPARRLMRAVVVGVERQPSTTVARLL